MSPTRIDGTAKPIEDIELGDTALATDPLAGETGAKTVAGTITTQGLKNLVELTVDTDGVAGDKSNTIVATAAHSFWIADESQWLDAGDIQTDRDLYSTHGALVDVLTTGSSSRTARCTTSRSPTSTHTMCRRINTIACPQ